MILHQTALHILSYTPILPKNRSATTIPLLKLRAHVLFADHNCSPAAVQNGVGPAIPVKLEFTKFREMQNSPRRLV